VTIKARMGLSAAAVSAVVQTVIKTKQQVARMAKAFLYKGVPFNRREG